MLSRRLWTTLVRWTERPIAAFRCVYSSQFGAYNARELGLRVTQNTLHSKVVLLETEQGTVFVIPFVLNAVSEVHERFVESDGKKQSTIAEELRFHTPTLFRLETETVRDETETDGPIDVLCTLDSTHYSVPWIGIAASPELRGAVRFARRPDSGYYTNVVQDTTGFYLGINRIPASLGWNWGLHPVVALHLLEDQPEIWVSHLSEIYNAQALHERYGSGFGFENEHSKVSCIALFEYD